MTNSASIVRRYLELVLGGPEGLDEARELLADDLDYRDPMMQARDADDLIAQLRRVGGGAEAEIRHVVADGPTVAALTEFGLPDGRAVTFAQWFSLDDGRIARIVVLYDPRPFLELAGSAS